MKYDIIISDFDMTLTNTDREITARTHTAIREFQKQGGLFVLCSARPYCALEPVIQDIKCDTVITNAGATTYDIDHKEYISKHPISPEIVKEVTGFLRWKTPHVHIINDINEYCRSFLFLEYACNKIIEYDFKTIGEKIFNFYPECDVYQLMTGNMYVPKVNKRLDVLRKAFSDKLEIGLCDKRLINLTAKGVTKGQAIEDILKHFSIPKERAIAFGDSPNDASMFKSVKTGVAMGNSMQELIDQADVVCDHCNNDGLAKYIEEHIL